jgi:hypothetical protein
VIQVQIYRQSPWPSRWRRKKQVFIYSLEKKTKEKDEST